mgnify:CR=1 FL=1
MLLRGLTWLVLFQMIGTAINHLLVPVVPGPIIGLLLIALFNLFQGPSSRGPQTSLAFSDFLSEVQSGRVTDVVIQDRKSVV